MRKILLVEDEDILRETYEIILSVEPYNLDTAVNGEDALRKCKENKYDLILLDLMMPVMDGVTFLVKLNEYHSVLPKIIILSNLSGGSELEQALKLGARRNILKASLSPKQLVTTIRKEVALC
jgi:CheY-like chemotaxis protein